MKLLQNIHVAEYDDEFENQVVIQQKVGDDMEIQKFDLMITLNHRKRKRDSVRKLLENNAIRYNL